MYNLSKTNKKILISFLIIFITISSLSLVKTDYYFMSPGPPYQWDIEYVEINKNLKLSESTSNDLRHFLPLIIGRCCSLGEIFEACSFLFEGYEFENKEPILLEHENKKILYDFTIAIRSANLSWDHESLNGFISSYCQENNFKFRDIGVPLRIAITGSTSSPSIVHIMEILGKQRSLERLNLNVEPIKN